MKSKNAKDVRTAPLATPSDLKSNAIKDLTGGLNALVADVYALYLKTKNFHWHMSGPHFRDYHLLLDEHGDQIFAMIDPLAARARKIGRPTLHSIAENAKLKRIKDNSAPFVSPADMLDELVSDNKSFTASLRAAHEVADKQN